MKIFDCHTHVYPQIPLPEAISEVRHYLNRVTRPMIGLSHNAQSYVRYLPASLRRLIDEASLITILQNLLIESNAEDHQMQRRKAGVRGAFVVAHPPLISNELILETCQSDPSLVPVLNVSPQEIDSLGHYMDLGVRALKIHPIAEGRTADDPHYQELLEQAKKHELLVIVHSGIIHSKVMFKNSRLGESDLFKSWVQEFPEIDFIFAHMNFYEPSRFLETYSRYENVYTTVSWQPTEVIAEAVDQLGENRVLFGSDWPLLGDNMVVQKNRVLRAQEKGLLTDATVQKIFYENIQKVAERHAISIC